MRTAALLVCALMAAQAHGYSQEYVRANSKLLWRAFKNDHGKRYTSQAEEDHRYGVFTSNMLKAARFEKEQTKGARFGSNVFSDLSAEEFKAYHSLQVPQKASPPPMFSAEEVKAAAGSVDWRVKGAGNTLTSVSEQELVSCDMVDNGCNGGLMDNAFKWLLDNHNGQIVMEESYPYASGQGTRYSCQDVSSMTVGATISSYKDITHSEEQMKAFVSTSGPLPIAVDATKWQTYTGGILTDCCGYSGCQLDHGVLIVGYGEDYWIVKNSWGSSWGESGYIRVGYGNNECGITGSPCAPVV